MADVVTEGMVRALLAELPGVDVDEIEIDVHGTTVALHGRVPTEREREQIETAARQMYGVEEVENHLIVTGEPI